MGLLSGWPLFFQRLITTLAFTFLRFVFMTIQKIRWHYNGTSEQMQECLVPQNYNRCAQVFDIVLFNKFCYLQSCSIKDYILAHNRFESPRYIFDNDHVSLITINEDHAIFGVAKKKGMHLWKFEYYTFMRLAQMFYCNQLIFVPLVHFHRMSEELGDPKGQLIFLFNTARCGSTLLTQMVQTTGKCISISEPDSFNVLALWYKSKGDSPKLRELNRDVVRWTCRPYKDFTPLAYMLKITSISAYALPMFKEIYPQSKYLFMYRDVVKVAQSMYRFTQEFPTIVMANTLGKFSAALTEKCVDAMGYSGKEFRYKFWDDLSLGVFLAIITSKSYVQLRQKGFDVCAVRYEDIIRDRQYAAKAILKFCGLPESLETEFLKGLDFDSQRGSIVSKEILSRHKDPPLTPESKRLANEALQKNGLPLIGEEWLLEGTITHKQ